MVLLLYGLSQFQHFSLHTSFGAGPRPRPTMPSAERRVPRAQNLIVSQKRTTRERESVCQNEDDGTTIIMTTMMMAGSAARVLGKGSLAAALTIGTAHSVWKQPETKCEAAERPQTLRNRVRKLELLLHCY